MKQSFEGFPADSVPKEKQATRGWALYILQESGLESQIEMSGEPPEALPAITSESFPFDGWGNDVYLFL